MRFAEIPILTHQFMEAHPVEGCSERRAMYRAGTSGFRGAPSPDGMLTGPARPSLGALTMAEELVAGLPPSASFGQRLLGVSVVGMDGGRLALWRVFVRTLLICLIIPAVVYDNTGRGLHDRAVGSVATRSRRPVQRT